jgi:hypothetical protein
MRSQMASRLALVLGIVGFVAWPLAYTWILRPATRPEGVLAVVPIVIGGAVIFAAAAIGLGLWARRAGDASRGAVWAPRLGAGTLLSVLAAFVLAAR